jgi:hypothetical protein
MAVGPGLGRATWPRVDEVDWTTPEALVREGFSRSRVVMMNEARTGLKRCERTRRIGARIMHMARVCGATLLAVEALGPPEGPAPIGGVLDQPDMLAMLDEARLQGFELSGYDVDERTTPLRLRTKVKSPGYTNWRDGQQAANLAKLLAGLPDGAGMLVWCTGAHLAKVRFMMFRPMGWQFMQATKVSPFAIDQTVGVDLTGRQTGQPQVVKWAAVELTARGGHAGYAWRDGLPRLSPGSDAWILSLDNRVT